MIRIQQENTIFSAWGMCQFRFILLIHPGVSLKWGVQRTKRAITIFQLILFSLLIFLAYETNAGRRFEAFCKATKYQIPIGDPSKFLLLGLQIVVMFKMTLYIVIFFYLCQKNQIQLGLKKEHMKLRKRKNIITLAGETACFCFSMFLFIFIHILQQSDVKWDFLARELGPIHLILGNAIFAICSLISSPEMMRFVFKIKL